tara:strand:- start:181 stop:453 length:273 start_codon:yes stop_codon:yes gene_type:complete
LLDKYFQEISKRTMSRFGDLLGGKTTTSPATVEPVSEIIEGDSDEGQVDLESLSKIELEEFGRELGIELDRRYNKKKLVKEIEDQLKKQE